MSERFTSEWLASYEARNAPAHRVGTVAADVGPEVELHGKIAAECRRRVWQFVYHDPTRPTTCAAGVCDFIIYADGGRMFHVECKSSTGKLSEAQLIFIAWLKRLGHTVHVVDSFAGFLEVVNGDKARNEQRDVNVTKDVE
jgi:hypothetical protein